MISFTEFLNKTFKQEIHEAAQNCIDIDNVYELPVSVVYAEISQIDTRKLFQFHDNMEFPVIITVRVSTDEDGRCYYRIVDMKGTISGTLTRLFKDFSIKAVGICKNRVKHNSKFFNDDLLPYLTKEQMTAIANKIISRDKPYDLSEDYCQRISPLKLAKKHGMKVLYCRLSDNGSIRGAYVFEDSYIDIYNPTTQMYEPKFVKANTILIDSSLSTKPDVMRFTVMHEIIHALVHKYALWLMRMQNHEKCSFSCMRVLFDSQSNRDSFIDRMEKQADTIASLLLMPKEPFCQIVDNMIKPYECKLNVNNFVTIIQKVARYFGVSLSAARRRMIECGYTMAEGVFYHIDGHYVPPFDFVEGSLKKDETFVISQHQLRTILSRNKKLLKAYTTRRIIFVENHLVLNSSEFVEGSGQKIRLTENARNNLHLCAFKFRMTFLQFGINQYDEMPYRGDILYRTAESRLRPEVIYADTNMSLEEKAATMKTRTLDLNTVKKKIGGDSTASFKAVYEWAEMNEKEVAENSWTDIRTIRRILNDADYQPKKDTLIRICIGMQLPEKVSIPLLQVMVGGLRNTPDDEACIVFLRTPELYNIEICNQLMQMQGFSSLGGKNPAI